MQRSHETPDETTVTLAEEKLSISRRLVEAGITRVSINTGTIEAAIRETLHGEDVRIERVAIGREVTEAPAVRHEEGGMPLIVPVIAEILVVERRLVLKEEIHIRRVPTTGLHEMTIPLRRQTASVTRGLTPDGDTP